MRKIFKKILLIPIIFSLFSCGETYKYNSYSDLQNDHITIEEIYSFENKTAIYFYQNGCSHCEYIEKDVCKFISLEEEKETKKFDAFKFVFFSPSTSELGIQQRTQFKRKPQDYNQQNLIDAMMQTEITSVSNTYFFGTPTLMVIENYKLLNYVVGDENIVGFLND